MIVVLDTNVLVSGVLNPFGKSAAIIRLIIDGRLKLAYDARILTEYPEVLHRPKFPFSEEQIAVVVDQIMRDGLSVSGLPLSMKLPDPDDEMFLEVAVSARAKAIIAGNRSHFPKECRGNIDLFSPAEFLDFFHSEQ